MTLFDTTCLRASGVTSHSRMTETLTAHANILKMTQTAENAVLRPRDHGAFPHELRAALAARVARLAGDEGLAAIYLSDAGNQAILADPAHTEAPQELSAVLAFVDKVANQTRDISAADVSDLQSAGMADADIVRLCELVAFLAYQTRLVAGLRLMEETAT